MDFQQQSTFTSSLFEKRLKNKTKNKIVRKLDLMNEQIKPVLMSYHFSAENDSAREVKVEP